MKNNQSKDNFIEEYIVNLLNRPKITKNNQVIIELNSEETIVTFRKKKRKENKG